MMGWGWGRYTYVTSYFMKEGNEREAFKDRQNLFSAAVDRISVRIYIYIRLRLLDLVWLSSKNDETARGYIVR